MPDYCCACWWSQEDPEDVELNIGSCELHGLVSLMKKLVIALPEERWSHFFSVEKRRKILMDFPEASVFPQGIADWQNHREELEQAEIILTGWGARPLPDWYEGEMARLILVLAGATRGNVPVVPKGARLVSASPALGFGVAEYCLSMLINAGKRCYWLANQTRRGEWRESVSRYGNWFELYGTTVGVIGCGSVGQALLHLLRPFHCEVLVYDPYLDEEVIASLGGRKAQSLGELFKRSRAVCLLASLNEHSRGMLGSEEFSLLQDGAVFINAARAPLIREEEFVRELGKQRFVAVLDVAEEEPPAADHPYRLLPNVMLTPHLAGAVAENRRRMGDYIYKQLYQYIGDSQVDSLMLEKVK